MFQDPKTPRLTWLVPTIALVAMAASIQPSSARKDDPPPSRYHHGLVAEDSIPTITLPASDPALLQTLAEARPEPGPFEVAEGVDLALGLGHGIWESVSGGRLWRLRIDSPGALHLNLGFGTFRIPSDATLHVTSATDEKVWYGPYTAADNSPHGLWTPIIPGDSLIVELFVPKGADEPGLEITRAGLGFVDLFGLGPPRHELQQCFIDAVCPESFMNDEERGVVRLLINNSGFCTGTLINDVGGTRTPFILTADHCGITAGLAPTVVSLFNFKVATCGGTTPGPQGDTVSGSTLRATRTDVDGTLIELSSTPPADFSVFYVGWDRSNTTPSATSGLHHPQGKSMAFSDDLEAPQTVDSCIGTGGVNSHWDVNWNNGPTQPGSSGSGLFDRSSRKVIGFLSGGSSECSGTATQGCCDCYGKFSTFWDGASSASRLKDWLDPGNTGTMMVNGLEGAVATRNLQVTKNGSGTGTVTSNPAGINCGATCNASFNQNASVTLTAMPSGGGMVFAGWGGACVGSGTSTTCNLTMNSDKAVTATFNSSNPCPSPIVLTCAETYSGTTVGATNSFQDHSCSGETYGGKDVLHKVTPELGGTLTVNLTNFTQDLDLLALTACNSGNCTEISDNGGNAAEQVTFAATAGTPYYLVVEDYFDSAGSAYDLTVSCPCTAPQGASQDLLGTIVSDTQTRHVCYLFRAGQGTQITGTGHLTIRAEKVVFLNDFTVSGQLTVRND